MKYSKIKFLTFFAIICSIGLAPINDASAAENTVTATITVGDRPYGIEFDSANNRMYVTNYTDDTVSVIDISDNTVTATITVGDRPYGIAFDSANNRMYVTNYADDTVSVIDTSDYSVIDANGVAAGTAIDVGDAPRHIAFDSANNRMYVANFGDDTVSVIDTSDNTVTAPITVGNGPYGIEFDSANNRMYVANLNDDTVSVIDTSDYSVIDANGVAAGTAIAVGNGPRDIEFDSANNRMYVANFNDDTVSVIDISDNTVTATITVGDRPYGIAFDSANNRMYVVNSNDDPVSVIDISDNTVTATITVGNGPRAIAFDSANNRMYVTNSNDDTVSVIDIAPPSSSSGCYDCTPPVLQNAHITILTNNYVVSTDDKPIHITANVGDEISIVLKITDNKSIDGITFVGIYTNFIEKPSDMNLFYANNFDNLKNISTSFYEWNVNSDDVAYDYDGTVSWSNGMPTVTDDLILGEYLMVPFTMTFTDSMDTSQITIKSFDASGNSLHVTLPVTLEIITKETILLSESEEMATLDKGDVIVTPSEDTTPLLNESVLLTVLSQWSGYSQVTSNDAEVLSVMGLHGDSLPAWTKHLGEWVIQEKLDVSELITAINYVNNQ